MNHKNIFSEFKMKVIKLTKAEKSDAWRIASTFKEIDATKQSLSNFSTSIGISTRYLEHMLWQLDTLYVLSRCSEDLVWKGGTCVQSYLPPNYQRYSIDLDFNVKLEKNNVFKLIEKINNKIMNENKYKDIEEVRFGTFIYQRSDEIIGSITFFRLVPVKHSGETFYKSQSQIKVIGAIPVRIQINYKLSKDLGCIAFNTIQKKPQLAPYRFLYKEFEFPHESIEDLLADKIVTMAEIPDRHRGRLRLKDSYDIIALILTQQKIDRSTILRKLEIYSEAWKTTKNIILDATKSAFEQIRDRSIEALGLRGSVGNDGYTSIILKWDENIKKAISFLELLQNAA